MHGMQKLERAFITAQANLFAARCAEYPAGALVKIIHRSLLARVVCVDPRDPFRIRVEPVDDVGRSEIVSVCFLQRLPENQELALEVRR